MPRERDGYRETLELINTIFPDGGVLTVEEAMEYLRLKTKDSVKKRLTVVDGRINKVELAKYLCGAAR